MKNFKTTIKEFNKNKEVKRCAKQSINEMNNIMRNGGSVDSAEYEIFQSIVEEKEAFFASIEKVNVSFCIGSRSYYQEAFKIGNTLFSNTKRKLTRSNGFNSVSIIPEITEKMTKEMISDSHYY